MANLARPPNSNDLHRMSQMDWAMDMEALHTYAKEAFEMKFDSLTLEEINHRLKDYLEMISRLQSLLNHLDSTKHIRLSPSWIQDYRKLSQYALRQYVSIIARLNSQKLLLQSTTKSNSITQNQVGTHHALDHEPWASSTHLDSSQFQLEEKKKDEPVIEELRLRRLARFGFLIPSLS
ncbi:hypothetical protein CROQUDRAFT_660941 [Cronartium quercuum f. sp. fusiforme G11]|uniref:Uncharacterized protein n=1 Tax=Cronartium quercuum f. sp. fusiforme G11 TaxID=708437 RepID=A0A9P6NGA9_9BASI|nr:hypothetical protein CROQUDRAFT_660941 [Cronartium quercuum f. sp. fusiforme G11]